MNSLNGTTEFESPTNADRKPEKINTNTPLSKGMYSSKSPKRSLLKKSKRRDCTPDSPQQSSSKLVQLCTQNGIGIEGIENLKPVELFGEKNKGMTRRGFTLTLIEENIEEVQEKYYDYLGKQNTPQSLYLNLFSTKVNEGKEEEKESTNEIFTKIKLILSDLNTCNFKILDSSQILMITPDLQSLEASLDDFKENFRRIELDETQFLTFPTDENGLYIVKTMIYFKSDINCNARILFSGKDSDSIEVRVVELNS